MPSLLLDSILIKGNVLLEQPSSPVSPGVLLDTSPEFAAECAILCRTLEAFRSSYGFGRAIAMPQIGILRRVIAINLGSCREADRYSSTLPGVSCSTFIMVNPVITYRSDSFRTLWDDCFSLPNMMVRVQRHTEVSVEWQDASTGELYVWDRKDMHFDLSELLQHEIDHLDGILATERQCPLTSPSVEGPIPTVIRRDDYEARKDHYSKMVDYVI